MNPTHTRAARRVALLPAILAIALLPAACGEETARTPGGSKAVVVVPVPDGGPLAGVGREMLEGAQVRLAMRGGSAGGLEVELRAKSQPQPAGLPDPEGVARLAAEAVADPETVAWLGGVDSNTTALALPVLNASGVIAVSPSAAATPFTLPDPAFPGAPAKYFPQAELFGMTFARIVATDVRIVRLGLPRVGAAGPRRTYLVDAGDTDGVAFTSAVRQFAPQSGMVIAGHETIVPGQVDWSGVIANARAADSDSIAWGSAGATGGAELWRAVADSGARLAMIAGPACSPSQFDLRPGPRSGTLWLSGYVGVRARGPDADRFASEFKQAHGRAPGPEATMAAAALDLILAAIGRGVETAGPRPNGDDLRGSVSRSLHSVRELSTPLGPVSVDRRGDRVRAPAAVWSFQSGRRALLGVSQ